MTTSQNGASMENSHELFREIVDRCHKKSLDQWIFNSATSHAAYLLQKLLQAAAKRKRGIRMISGRLERLVYDQLTDALQKCMDAEVEMDVVVLDGVDGGEEGNVFYRKLRAYPRARRYAPAPGGKKIRLPHMLVVGDSSLRYEVNRESHEARANFNSPAIAGILIEHFDELIGGDAVVSA
ncbi:MAG: hypothetical protein MPK31_01800 [Gammaproteobacteria bacterium]|nr:hypothetical protein [Gammaproteobacteria bacterium]MDA8015512.1 hypothetical protein [Gammaproteobacteria bacterium]